MNQSLTDSPNRPSVELEPVPAVALARRPMRGRLVRTVVLLAIALIVGLLGQAAPANASINRGYIHTVPGTNCTVTVGGWPNTRRYPGTASSVSCSTPHSISVRNQIWYAGTNGVPALFAQSVWYNFSRVYSTGEIDSYRAACPGFWDWLSGAQVYVDGVYRGTFYNSWGWWTACT